MKKIVSITTFAVMAAFAMTTLAPMSYAQGKGDSRSNSGHGGHAYGHFIAPGWLKKHERPSLDGVILPYGIAKKIHHDDDDDNGSGTHDTTAPSISAINVDHTDTTATITWNTNEPAKSKVYVSIESPVNPTDVDTKKIIDRDLETAHSVVFTGLSPSTTYHALIKVTDSSGNVSTSSEFTFVTSAAPDITAPLITNSVINPDYNSAMFTWDTNEAAYGTVYLSTSTPVNVLDSDTLVFASSSLTTHHSINASGLDASTTYYALITSRDASGNTGTSSQLTFTTDVAPDTTDPIISNVVLDVGTSTATVDWTTNEPATSVEYLSTTTGFATSDAGVMTVFNMSLTNNHSLMFTGLTASSTYYLRVKSVDASLNDTLSSEIVVTTI